jgi:hypothetical protein
MQMFYRKLFEMFEGFNSIRYTVNEEHPFSIHYVKAGKYNLAFKTLSKKLVSQSSSKNNIMS